MTYEVALEALGKDATNWDDTATVLTTEGATARGLTLTTADLSFAADWTGLTSTYSSLQNKVAGLLEGRGHRDVGHRHDAAHGAQELPGERGQGHRVL